MNRGGYTQCPFTPRRLAAESFKRHNERVELRAADDAEANRKIRDMDRPLGVVSISVVPDRDEPATADRVERQWVANDDHITLQAFRSDLGGERFLNSPLDDEVWDDVQITLERDGSIKDLVYAYLKDQWDIGPGTAPEEEE